MNSLDAEMRYTKQIGYEHIRSFGQYFTDHKIAEFMCRWACKGATSMLDPAAGNSVFLTHAKKLNSQCVLTGYEVDSEILNYFGNPAQACMYHKDYLESDWTQKYDAIVCNPPYNRFQEIPRRKQVLDLIEQHTGLRCSSYTNLYILFLIKSIFSMSDHGRLAYLIPSEFMNSQYGTMIKALIVQRNLLRTIIHFNQDAGIFSNATTTCCILLLDREPKSEVSFFSLDSTDELNPDLLFHNFKKICIPYKDLNPEAKWRPYLNHEKSCAVGNLRPVSDFCTVSRGIATGANSFFCFSSSKARKMSIPMSCLTPCICRCADIKLPVFHQQDFDFLEKQDKTVFLLDITSDQASDIAAYIQSGMQAGINRKYLPSHRNPWYAMEQKKAAPIWVTSASRKEMKFVRNLTHVKSLTTFHSLFVHDEYMRQTDLIFCYFLTPTAQNILRENRKVLGNSLEKFQPNDLNHANMLDISKVTSADQSCISEIYARIEAAPKPEYIRQLDHIFSSYLNTE